MSRVPRAGFTLIEVSVVVVLTALVLAGARATLGAMLDHSTLIAAVGRETSERENGERTLRALTLHAEAGTDSSAAFDGTAARVTFETWCVTHRGWRERCRITLTLDRDESGLGGQVVRAWLPGGEPVHLLDVAAPAWFAFLDDPAHGGTWSATWGPSVIAPRAVGVFSAGDTLILPVGGHP